MAARTISLELDAYERLRRARFGPSEARGGSILAALDELPIHAADEEAARRWEESGLAERTASAPAWE